MKIKTDLKLMWMWRHPVRSRWVCMRSEVKFMHLWPSIAFWPLTKNPNLWPFAYSSWIHSHMPWNWLLTSCILIMTSQNDVKHSNQFQSCFDFHWPGATAFLLGSQNGHWALIDCHTPVILQLGKDKILIYLIKIEFWPNISYFLILSHFSNCLLLFDTPCIVFTFLSISIYELVLQLPYIMTSTLK